MTERKAVYWDSTAGALTQTSLADSLTAAPTDALAADVARCKLALRLLGVDPDLFDAADLLA